MATTSDQAPGASDSRTYRRQVLTIALGAAIGFVPAATLAVYQAHVQREQFLFDHRVSALREFSLAVSDEGELIIAVSELDVAINHIARNWPRKGTKQEWKRVDSLYKAVTDRRYKWVARLNAETAVIQALFAGHEPEECRVQSSLLSYSPYASAERPDAQSQKERIDYMKANVGKFKRDLTASIDSTQTTVRCQAAHLR